jgi:hypothetical protein
LLCFFNNVGVLVLGARIWWEPLLGVRYEDISICKTMTTQCNENVYSHINTGIEQIFWSIRYQMCTHLIYYNHSVWLNRRHS